MIPEADTMLNGAAMKLLLDIAPLLPPGYGQGSASTVAMVMMLAAQQFDKGADNRLWEIEAMRTLLARGGTNPGAAGTDRSIAALNAEHAALSRSLIELHARIEGEDRPLEADILAYLKESAARRRLHLPAL